MDSIHDTSHWWYDNAEPVSSYNYCPWVYVPAFKNYMINHNYFYNSTFEDANKGCVAITKSTAGYDHVFMITKNDTINRALSAHTTDRKHYWYSGSNVNPDGTIGNSHSSYYQNYYDFYGVHCIVEASYTR